MQNKLGFIFIFEVAAFFLAKRKGSVKRVKHRKKGVSSPSAAKTMRTLLEGMKQVEIIEPVVTLRGKMKEADLPQLEALAEAIL